MAVIGPAVAARASVKSANQTLDAVASQVAATWPIRAVIADDAPDDTDAINSAPGSESA